MLICAWLLVGCGRGVDSQFQPYVTRFVVEGKPYGLIGISSIQVFFGDTGERNRISVCRSDFSGPQIIVSEAAWKCLDDSARESLMFHELGHCVLGRDHKNTWIGDRPESLMLEGIVTGSAYQEYRGEYLKELFTGRD